MPLSAGMSWPERFVKELDFHVRMRAEEYERAGEPPAAAARRARRRLGNLAILQDRGDHILGEAA